MRGRLGPEIESAKAHSPSTPKYRDNNVRRLLQGLVRKAQLVVASVENHVLRLEKHISVNGKRQRRGALDAPKAHRRRLDRLPVNGRERHKLPGDHGLVLAQVDCERGDLVLAVENEAAVGRVELRAGDALVVCRDDVVREEHQGCAGVGNGLVRLRNRAAVGADSVALRGELPEPFGRVGRDEFDFACELRGVEETEVVVSGCRDPLAVGV